MTDSLVLDISDRYIELYENITGEKFNRADTAGILQRIEGNILGFLASQG